MTLPRKPPMARRKRLATAAAVAVLAHLFALPFIARDAVFRVPPQRHRAQVGLVSQRNRAAPRVPSPDSTPSAGHNDPLEPQLPKDALAELKQRELQKAQGQVVDLGQPQDERAPTQPTKYLSEKDSRVLKETRARETSAFFKNALSKAQQEGKQEKRPAAPQAQPPPEPPPGAPAAGQQGGAQAAAEQKPQPTPARERQDALSLKTGRDGTVRNRAAHDAVPGSDRRVAMAQPREQGQRSATPAPGPGTQAPSGAPGGKGKPLKLTLDRPLDVLGPVSGGPMSDDLKGVEEGDETLLNSRSFRYAGYLNRVKETVARIWVPKVESASEHRDPTGQTYSYKDRSTVVAYRLDARGEIKEVRVASSSGVPYLDEAATSAFKEAERFPNPPPGLVGPNGEVVLTFSFTLLAATGRPRIQTGPTYWPPAPGMR